MRTAIDTNVVVALWNPDDTWNLVAQNALDVAEKGGALVICGAVYAELLGSPGRTERFVDGFCRDSHIDVEWQLSEHVWRAAGTAFQGYAKRRRKLGGTEPRRILTDFVIGAHALVGGYRLLTLDEKLYRASFPNLKVTSI